jgi:hypothetical protein
VLIFFAENWRKSQKIEIITSTPGLPDDFFVTRNVAQPIFRQKYHVRLYLLWKTLAHFCGFEKNAQR